MTSQKLQLTGLGALGKVAARIAYESISVSALNKNSASLELLDIEHENSINSELILILTDLDSLRDEITTLSQSFNKGSEALIVLIIDTGINDLSFAGNDGQFKDIADAIIFIQDHKPAIYSSKEDTLAISAISILSPYIRSPLSNTDLSDFESYISSGKEFFAYTEKIQHADLATKSNELAEKLLELARSKNMRLSFLYTSLGGTANTKSTLKYLHEMHSYLSHDSRLIGATILPVVYDSNFINEDETLISFFTALE